MISQLEEMKRPIVPLIVYLDYLLFMLELFGFVNSSHFCRERRRAIEINASFFWINDFSSI